MLCLISQFAPVYLLLRASWISSLIPSSPYVTGALAPNSSLGVLRAFVLSSFCWYWVTTV
jgi:hypothetical protein